MVKFESFPTIMWLTLTELIDYSETELNRHQTILHTFYSFS